MKKQNLDKLFQEKFKDFDELPDEKVWNSLEASLDQKKKKRKVIPIWWRLGGVAAAIAVVLYATNPFKNGTQPTPPVTNVEENKDPNPVTSEENTKELYNGVSPEEVVATPEKENTLVENEGISANAKQASVKKNNRTVQEKNVYANTQHTQQPKARTPYKKSLKSTALNADAIIAKKEELVTAITQQDEATTVMTDKNTAKNALGNGHLETTSDAELAQNELLKEDEKKKSIFDEINEEEEEKAIAKNDASRWSVGPSVAPVFFDSFGEGSPIHSNFVPNAKSGNLNLSYGVAVSYEINKKLRLRTGLHKVDYGYDTNDVAFSSSLSASTNTLIDNISYKTTAQNLVLESNVGNSSLASNSADLVGKAPTLVGRMVQEFGYVEVPLELNYSLLDKKIGIDVTGGISSLFLVNNTITLVSQDLTTEVGEANNLNDVNFSTNIGFGVNYKFSSKIQANIEPLFKYQLNTFSETAGSFNPFSIGVYSGIQYKF